MEGGIALGHVGHVRARHLERHGPAEAVAHHHQAIVDRPLARLAQAGLQQRAHPRTVLVERAGRGAAVIDGLGRRLVAEHVQREGVVAHLGQHVGALALVVGHPVPVMDDHHQALRVFGLGPVPGEGFAFVGVGNVLGQRRRGGQGGNGKDREQSHGSSKLKSDRGGRVWRRRCAGYGLVRAAGKARCRGEQTVSRWPGAAAPGDGG